MAEICPACGKLALTRSMRCPGLTPSYACHSCKWESRSEIILLLKRLGRPINPGVVYLVELLSIRNSEVSISGSYHTSYTYDSSHTTYSVGSYMSRDPAGNWKRASTGNWIKVS